MGSFRLKDVSFWIQTLRDGFEQIVTEEKQFEHRDESNYQPFLEKLDQKNCEAVYQLKQFSKGASSTDTQLSIETIIEGVKPIVTDKHDFGY